LDEVTVNLNIFDYHRILDFSQYEGQFGHHK